MSREIIDPKDKEHWLNLRKEDVTSTEVAALFGMSPYMTEYELYHRKKDKSDVAFDVNQRMRWGNRLESAIANGIAEDNNLEVRPMKEYIRDSDLKMGASFDFAVDPTGILEIKNVDSLAFKNGWLVDGDDVEAPQHIELQVQSQLAVSGREFALIGAFIGGNNVVLIRREPDDELIKAIKEKIYNFWRSVEKGKAPDPNFIKDAEFIKQIYNVSKQGKVITASEQINTLAKKYKEAAEIEKKGKQQKDAAKAEILTLIDDAAKVDCDHFTISCGMVEDTLIESFTRKGFRNFKVNPKKEGK
jgi:putative phage-type endonuclease